jgi:hypothetical protein
LVSIPPLPALLVSYDVAYMGVASNGCVEQLLPSWYHGVPTMDILLIFPEWFEVVDQRIPEGQLRRIVMQLLLAYEL